MTWVLCIKGEGLRYDGWYFGERTLPVSDAAKAMPFETKKLAEGAIEGLRGSGFGHLLEAVERPEVGRVYLLRGGNLLRYQGAYAGKGPCLAFRGVRAGLDTSCPTGYSADLSEVLREVTSADLPWLEERERQSRARNLWGEVLDVERIRRDLQGTKLPDDFPRWAGDWMRLYAPHVKRGIDQGDKLYEQVRDSYEALRTEPNDPERQEAFWTARYLVQPALDELPPDAFRHVAYPGEYIP